MSTLLDITRRSPEPSHQEIAEPRLGAGNVVRGIHRSENRIARDLPVERADEALEPVFPDHSVQIELVHDDSPVRHDRAQRRACPAWERRRTNRKMATVIATTTTITAAPTSVNHTTKSRPSRTNVDRTEETAPVATAGPSGRSRHEVRLRRRGWISWPTC